MGLLDTIIGSVLGGNNPNQGALGSILGSLLQSQGGVGGLVQKMNQAGLGDVVSSWVGGGSNHTVEPGQLGQVLGRDQVDQWSQQTGMSHDTILSQLSKILPHAVDQMTPGGQVPPDGQSTSPFDAPGLELKS
ncbi:MAG: DUF937 domain-containing protein [Alphaproteobacteria bacterium]|nr:MAG: DUF937 domain-containing protein [Alphaproteobacteria bacterium]